MKRIICLFLALFMTHATYAMADMHDHNCADTWPKAVVQYSQVRKADIFFHWTPNGCGPDGIIGKIVPEKIYFGKVNFTEACNNHDRCFMTIGARNKVCQRMLEQDLRAACRRDLPSFAQFALRETCLLYVNVKAEFVRTFSAPFYKSSIKEQQRFDQCVSLYGYHPRETDFCKAGRCQRAPQEVDHGVLTPVDQIRANTKKDPDDFLLGQIAWDIFNEKTPSEFMTTEYYGRDPGNKAKVEARVAALKSNAWAEANPLEHIKFMAQVSVMESETRKLSTDELKTLAVKDPSNAALAVLVTNRLRNEAREAKIAKYETMSYEEIEKLARISNDSDLMSVRDRKGAINYYEKCPLTTLRAEMAAVKRFGGNFPLLEEIFNRRELVFAEQQRDAEIQKQRLALEAQLARASELPPELTDSDEPELGLPGEKRCAHQCFSYRQSRE